MRRPGNGTPVAVSLVMMSHLSRDLRQSVRRFGRRPAFVILVVATLGIGVGASTTIWSVIDAVIFQPLPYPDPERLVAAYEVTPGGDDFALSEANFIDFERGQRSFEDMAAFRGDELALTTPDGEPIRLFAARVTPSFFDLLGARARRGRTVTSDETRTGGEQTVAVLSHEVWQRSFGGDPSVVGTTISLSDRPHVVIGVLEPDFDMPPSTEVWVPLVPRADAPRGHHDLTWIARLAPGIGLGRAQEDLATVARGLGETYPDTNRDWSVRLQPLRDAIIGPDLGRRMAVILGAVGLLMLIACVNVSNLLLAQGLERRSELALRAAMGASRPRLLRQLMTESLALATAGAGLGLLIASWAIPLIQRFSPGGVARLDEAAIDGRALIFATVVAASTGVVSGLIPATRVLAGDLSLTVRDGRPATAGGRLRDALVVTELALAMTLLLGATLLGRSFIQLLDADLGIETNRVIAAQLTLPGSRYTPEQRVDFFRRLDERLRAMPAIEQVSATNILPIAGSSTVMGIAVEGRPGATALEGPTADWRAVRPGIFETLGVPLLRGRGLRDADIDAAEPVVVISESLANQLLPSQNPIGQRLALWEDPERVHTVVGVVADLNDIQLQGESRQTVYFPDNGGWPWMTLLVRARSDVAILADPLRQAIWEIDPNLPVPAIESLDERKSEAAAPQRFTTALMTAFSVVASLLAAIGVYGLLSYLVTGHAREIGIRMALGAQRANVLGLILGRATRLTFLGIVLGTGTALALNRTIESLLFETAPTDPVIYLVVACGLFAVALAASLLPARRASRLSPTLALNGDL